MRIAIGSDHRGVKLRSQLVEWLEAQGHAVDERGACGEESVDYPDVASVVGRAVAHAEADRGILLCGTGIGMAIAANKIRGVRAATVHSTFEAEISRRHNDLNVLCLSAETEPTRLQSFITAWLETPFDGGRHARRVAKIAQIEQDAAGEEH